MMRVNAEVSKHELIGALRDATIDNAAFDVREWSRHDANTLRRIADLIDRELNELVKKDWSQIKLSPSIVLTPTEGEDLPKTPTP